jgi:hypothetical protein
MTRQRRGYLIALVVAVLALIVSVGSAIGFALASRTGPAGSRQLAPTSDGWQSGPGAGMMGGQRWGGGGMMDDWNDQGTATITPAQAQAAAEAWVAANQPAASLNAGPWMPMGYLFTLTKDGVSVGTIVVDDDTGQVTWWQRATPWPSSLAS